MSESLKSVNLSFFKLLVVESDAARRDLYTVALAKSGVRFKSVTTDLALSTLQEERYDMILTEDAALIQKIRMATESFRNIPVLKLSLEECKDDLVVTTRLAEAAQKVYAHLPVLDPSSIEKIRMFDDEHQSLVRSLYDIYSSDTAAEVQLLGQLIAASNLVEARKKAHKLKSSAAQLGAMRFEKYCNLMEYEADLTRERAQELFLEMKEEYEQSRERFQKTCLTPSQSMDVSH